MDLTAQQLVVEYEGTRALDRVSLSIPWRSVALLTGRAGCGKTTLLKSLAGLIPPESGTVTWGAENLDHLSDHERSLWQSAFGMVFQTNALFDSMTVLENVVFPLRKRNVPYRESADRARKALATVDLTGAEDLYPEQLSTGMARRAGIARAIVAEPAILIADSPWTGLDPRAQSRLSELLLSLSERRTLLCASPEPVPSLPVPRWVVLDQGRILHDGPPDPALLGDKA